MKQRGRWRYCTLVYENAWRLIRKKPVDGRTLTRLGELPQDEYLHVAWRDAQRLSLAYKELAEELPVDYARPLEEAYKEIRLMMKGLANAVRLVCPWCVGNAEGRPNCPECKGRGWLRRYEYETISATKPKAVSGKGSKRYIKGLGDE